jgi:hypothetical protein
MSSHTKEQLENPHAFPILEQNTYHGESKLECTNAGMTLRDYYAAKAMQSILISAHPSMLNPENAHKVTEASYCMADEMLRERIK